jgi:pimeloyl-ACP methyl ester carboxylesterase
MNTTQFVHFVLRLLAFYFFIPGQGMAQAVNEEMFISIGGIDQWITINGDDRDNPVVLFIHGGPGSVMSPYEEAIYGAWRNQFTLVNWDQRGAGRTFGRMAPEELDEDFLRTNPLTVAQMVDDGLAVTKYLLKFLDKQKVILAGTSWGSILAARMALLEPDLFHLYLAHAQFVNFNDNLDFAYQKVFKLSKKAGDTASLRQFETLGAPPYSEARALGQLLRVVKKFERENATPAPDTWWQLPPEYNNEKDNKDRYNGDDYSFLFFAGHEKLGIQPMAAGIDFRKTGLHFNIPVYFIQGEHDILTSGSLNKPYYEEIRAPKKEYYLVPDAGHGHNQSVVDMQYGVLKEWLLLNSGENKQ